MSTVLIGTVRRARDVVVAPGWTRRVGLLGIAIFTLAALLAPVITRFDPIAINPLDALQGPSARHWFGTDNLGRDIFTRVLFAARIDLQIGLIGVTIPLVIGVLIGLAIGFYGGWIDSVVGRIIDVFVAFPFLVLIIAIVAMLGPGLANFYIAVSLVSWVAYARIIRGEVLTTKRREYVMAAHALGFRSGRIMLRHILPNVLPPALVFAMSDFVLDILAGASLGFFGLGVQSPTPEWGVMIAEGRNFIITAPWVVVFPGLAIVAVGFFFSLFGDGLADWMRRVHLR